MPSTARGFRYPAGSAAPNVPQDLANLAADLQTEFDDNLTGTTTFLPVLTATTTNPTLGTGSIRKSWYVVHDDVMVDYCFFVQFGTSGAAAGSGQYQISLPLPAAVLMGTAAPEAYGSGLVRDNSAVNVVQATWYIPGTLNTVVVGYAMDSTINQAGPFAWANQDYLAGSIRYRMA